jgi:hypothetical protein
MAQNFKFVQNQFSTLAGSGCTIGATTITLVSFTQIDGTPLTMTDFGAIGFGTLEPGNGAKEEQIAWTGIVLNANGTSTLTGVAHVLFVSPYTRTSGTTMSHPGGIKFIVTNTAGFYDQFVAKDDDGQIDETLTFTNPNYPRMDTATPPPTDDEQLATKKYVDDTAIAGAPNATTTVKGIVEIATQAEVDAKTAIGGTGASLVPTPALARSTLLSDYVADTGAANAYVITPSPAITAYTAGQIFSFKAANTNTTTSTLNVNALGAKTINKLNGATALAVGDIVAGQIVTVEYDGTVFQMISPAATTVELVAEAYPAGNGAAITGIVVSQVAASFTAGASITIGKPVVVLPFPAANVLLDTKLSGTGTAANTFTQAFSVASNSNRILVVAVTSQGTSVHISGITYAGVALTNKVEVGGLGAGGDNRIAFWYIVAPTTGTNNLIFTATGSTSLHFNIYSYYNVAQTGVPETSTSGTSSSAAASASLTPLTNGALIMGATYDGTPSGSAYTNNLLANSQISSGDSGVLYPPSSQTMSETGGSNNNAVILISLQPVAAGSSARVYTSSSAQAITANSFTGIAQSTVTVGQTLNILTNGIDTNQLSLTIGALYYLNDTPGNIGTSAGTVSRKAGIATSATSILITNIW